MARAESLATYTARDRLTLRSQATQPMDPQTILRHYDQGHLWTEAPSREANVGMPAAYQSSLAVRDLRIARGEIPRGFKIGFTNRNIWPRYNVYAPIWGTVYDTTLSFCDGPVSYTHLDVYKRQVLG